MDPWCGLDVGWKWVGHLDVGVPLNREPQTRADTSGQAAKQINVRILEKSADK